jgi:hypothetical protein
MEIRIDLTNDFLNEESTLFLKGNIKALKVLYEYRTRGIKNFLLKDLVSSKNDFYKATKVSLFTYVLRKRGINLSNEEVYPYFAWVHYDMFVYAILCGNEELLVEFMNEIEYFGDEKFMKKSYAVHVSYALKYLFLNDFPKAREWLSKLSNPKIPAEYRMYTKVIRGILEGNIKLIEEGINDEIKWHKSNRKDNYFFPYCPTATAYIKLARRFGYEVKFNKEYIMNELLFDDPNFQYEGLPEIEEIVLPFSIRLSVSE